MIADINLLIKKEENKKKERQRKERKEKTIRGIKLNINQRAIPV